MCTFNALIDSNFLSLHSGQQKTLSFILCQSLHDPYPCHDKKNYAPQVLAHLSIDDVYLVALRSKHRDLNIPPEILHRIQDLT